MAKPYNFLPDVNDVANIKITANGTYFTEVQWLEFESAVMYIAAYDSSGNIVTPSVGTATFSVETIGGQFVSAPSDGDNPVDLTLIGEDSTYNMPLFLGGVRGAKLVLSGADFVTDGIAYFKAYCWRV